jgi:hypothetical protein
MQGIEWEIINVVDPREMQVGKKTLPRCAHPMAELAALIDLAIRL